MDTALVVWCFDFSSVFACSAFSFGVNAFRLNPVVEPYGGFPFLKIFDFEFVKGKQCDKLRI